MPWCIVTSLAVLPVVMSSLCPETSRIRTVWTTRLKAARSSVIWPGDHKGDRRSLQEYEIGNAKAGRMLGHQPTCDIEAIIDKALAG